MDIISQIKDWYASEHPPSALEVSRRLKIGEHSARALIKDAGISIRDFKVTYAYKPCKRCGEKMHLPVRSYYCDTCIKLQKKDHNKAEQLRVKESQVRKKPKVKLKIRKCRQCKKPISGQYYYYCRVCWNMKDHLVGGML